MNNIRSYKNGVRLYGCKVESLYRLLNVQNCVLIVIDNYLSINIQYKYIFIINKRKLMVKYVRLIDI